MTRKRGRPSGSSGTSLSAHSGQASDGEPPAVTKLGLLHDHPAAPIERDGELVGRRAHKQSKRLGVFRVKHWSISSHCSLLHYRGYSAGWAGSGSLSALVADWLMQQATCLQLLLRLEQIEARCEPFFTCPGHVLPHSFSLLWGSIAVRSVLDATCWLVVVID